MTGAAMSLSDVEALIARAPRSDEWVDLEFKKTTAEREAAMETLCAFLNGRGGTVIFGVTPAGRIVGQDVSDQTVREVTALFQHVEPGAMIELHRVPVADAGGKELLVLGVVPLHEQQPYTYRAHAYWRDGSSTTTMPQAVMQQLLARREHAKTRWENRVADGVTLDDLDAEEIRRTLRLGIDVGRIQEEGALEPADILAKLHLMRDGRPLNAAVALFGRPAPGDFPQCRLHLAHFDGLTKDADMLDHRPPIYGHAFLLAREAEAFLRRRLPQAGRLVPGLFARADEPLFPTKALREVLHNALAHRDYAHPGGSVHVAIYADRVEVTNSGGLPPDLTVADLKRVHESKPRNPLIADVFYLRGLIDEWGRGTRAVVRLCTQAGHPEPEFFELPGGFGVRLPSARPLGPARATAAVTPRQQDILNLLAAGPLPLRDIAARVGGDVKRETVGDDLAVLKAAGLVAHEGRGRSSAWSVLPAALHGGADGGAQQPAQNAGE